MFTYIVLFVPYGVLLFSFNKLGIVLLFLDLLSLSRGLFIFSSFGSSSIVFSPSRAYEWDGHEYGHGGTVALHVTF